MILNADGLSLALEFFLLFGHMDVCSTCQFGCYFIKLLSFKIATEENIIKNISFQT